MQKIKAILIATAASVLCANAQDDQTKPIRPVTSAYMAEFGWAGLADTYLTPLHYDGNNIGLLYERTQAMNFNPQDYVMQLNLGASLDLAKNPAKNATMSSLMLRASWGMYRRWQLPRQFTLGLGGSASLDAGTLYLSRNGNNPASAKAALTVNATGYAAWSHKVWKIPFTLRYQATLPVIGVFFSPQYAQLYYQIYLGDTKDITHAAWWGSYFAYDNMISADLHFGSTTLRIGYHGRYHSTKVNNLVTHDISNAVVLGIVCDWISLSRNKPIPTGQIINAY